MTWAKSWGMSEWSFEDLCYRYDAQEASDDSTDDESIQITLIKFLGGSDE